MCGIAGIFASSVISLETVRQMTDPIAHRGPDDQGAWIDQEVGLGLGHRRLAIIDLSAAGHQPLASANGRYVLTYNGEIYNHISLRQELDNSAAGPPFWRGLSDTETLLECISAWGLKKTLQKTVGMFALAVWDKQTRELHLARDRFGEKPLYYGWIGGDFLFASELKAMRVHRHFRNEVSRKALGLLASRTYVPAPLSIYKDIYKLHPGCILTVTPAVTGTKLSGPPVEGRQDGINLERYWSYREVVAAGLADPLQDEAEALEQLEEALAEAVRGQAMADVPVGAFLSGGIDSSSVVALYQKYSSQPVHTFSIGFEEAGYNEAQHAKEVARHFSTQHNERYVTVRETQEVIPLLPSMYDEPFGDSSQIPTYLVSKFAREQVTVALSGDGGDELFGGYNRYLGAARLWAQLKRLPSPARSVIGRGLAKADPAFWNGVGRLLPSRRPDHFGTKVQKAFRTMAQANSLEEVFNTFLDEWSGESSPVLGSGSGSGFDMDVGAPAPDAVRMMYGDSIAYLPDDILCKVDRASMATSLESRVPFLDHRVAQLAARIPATMKIKDGKGKHILRELLYREAPRHLFERPKAGFAVPVGQWIRGPLRPWAEDLLDERRLRHEGYFNAPQVRRRWEEHLSGQRDATPALWAVLMFQAWVRTQNEAVNHSAPERLAG